MSGVLKGGHMSIPERFLQTVTRSEKREVEFKHTIALRIQSAELAAAGSCGQDELV